MGLIKEPKGVDFYFDSTPLTEEQKKKISELIAHYKATGKKRRFVPHRHGAIQGAKRKGKSKILA